MFIIWYLLFSFLYLITLILYYFFCKVLKFNDAFFNVIFFKINNTLNFNDLVQTKITLDRNNTNSLKFKNLYNESALLNNFYFKSFKNTLIFSTLNKKISSSYSTRFNFLSFIFFKNNNKNLKFKKINLNYLSNLVYSINTNSNLISSLQNAKKYNFSKITYNNVTSKISVLISENLTNLVNKNWLIKYSPSNFIKYINYSNVDVYNILYLRKNKVFNKGRYSRNRQYYRTGVYWCLYVNIVAVIGIYFWFYRFTMNFGYLWWLLFLFIASFIVPKAIKYRLYNPLNLFNSLVNDILWLSYILLSIHLNFKNILNYILNYFKNYVLNFSFFKYNLKNSNLFNIIYLNDYKLFFFIKNCKIINNSIFMWEYNNTNYYYTSIIKSRPVIIERLKNFFKQIFNFCFSIW